MAFLRECLQQVRERQSMAGSASHEAGHAPRVVCLIASPAIDAAVERLKTDGPNLGAAAIAGPFLPLR